MAVRFGARTSLAVPLFREGVPIGAILVRRAEVRPFSEKHIAVLQTFANQAVIAIENVSLFDEVQARTAELQDSLEYQTATSDVLSVISRSPSHVLPVLKAIVHTAGNLCRADLALFYSLENGMYRLVAANNPEATLVKYALERPIPPGRGSLVGRTALERSTVHLPDCLSDPEFTYQHHQRVGAFRSMLGVPLLRDGTPVGVFSLLRTAAKPFSDKQIELVETFADQAVIAIENARLFAEVQARTKELQESLEYQTATSDVLNVISRSPNQLQPVLDAIVETAGRLCGAYDANLWLRQGERLKNAAHRGPIPVDFDSWPIGRGWTAGRAFVDRATVHVDDLAASDEFPDGKTMALRLGHRTIVSTPLMRKDEAIGVLAVRRTEVRPFSEKQIALLQTFADQAVIAIENVRLFDEVQARTAELSESLEYQTATSEVLNVISRAPSQLQPVFEAIVETAGRLCEAEYALVYRLQDGKYQVAASNNAEAELIRYAREHPLAPGRESVIGRTALEGRTVHIPDCLTDPEYKVLEYQKVGKYRTNLGIPLVRDGVTIGVIGLMRSVVKPFTSKQVELVETFADQAVIAIENVRLFDEVQARTGELSRSVSELQALGEVSHAVNSTLDLETVLSTIVAKAVQLSATDAGAIYVFSNLRQKFRLRATYGMSTELIEAIGQQSIGLGESYIGGATQRREPLQVPDLKDEPPTSMRDIVLHAGYRGLLVVPLLRPNRIVGALVVRRKEPGVFPQSTLDLLQTFAAQSVVAIQNARLFSEIEEKSREIEIASRHKSQFLANMSHELRTPMNAVLGFTEMMSDGLYGQLPDKALKALERVQANGRHLLGLINDVLDLSKIEAGQLTLALDDYSIGQVVQTVLSGTESLAKAKGLALTAKVQEGLPIGRGDERRLTQVLLNLVGNAIKFTDKGSVEIAAGAADGFFDIAVRDTGPGIAPDDQKRIFEEFQQVDSSSTRQKGGTGLGLAISQRLVEMHGGTIAVESVLGEGSTFRIAVPVRAAERMEAA
ncbi:MAG: GAF domain-containing protein [Microvirga sp.]